MTSIYNSVLSDEDIRYLNTLPEVLTAKASLDAKQSGKAYFSVRVTDSIRAVLLSRFGLEFSLDSSIPMRWIKGDTAPHIDSGASHFENTYLLYLNSSPGELIIDSQSYPIEANTGFVFNEGLNHETINTGTEPRLLLGPMSEAGIPVGGANITYYETQANALATTAAIGYNNDSFIVGNVSSGTTGGFTSWRIASNSIGPANQSLVYTNGQTLAGTQYAHYYHLYPSVPCFLEGTTILCQVEGVESYVPVEQLKNGTLVKTSLDGFKKVVGVGKGSIQNPGNDERIENRLYKCSPSKYPALKEDLYITGCHSILEFPLTEEQNEATVKHLGRLFVTDKKHRLMACLDERAEPWNSEGEYTIYHFALENTDILMNYGVYANGGLLVETCNINFLNNKSNMKLIN